MEKLRCVKLTVLSYSSSADKDGKIWGPFEDPTKATAWAEKNWPNVPFRDDADELACGQFWDIEPIYPAQ
jgi:hypothetical protein